MTQKRKRAVVKDKDYTLPLTDVDWVRIYFSTSNGKLRKFIVQYYSLINGKKRCIIRIDNCHGYPHRHTYYSNKREANVSIGRDAKQAFTEAREYVIIHFQSIKDNYLLN